MIAVRIAGSGGQGIQRAGVVLAEAAVRSGLNAACAQTYGPESRGGPSRVDVIVSDGEILYPRLRQPDVLMILSPDGWQFAPGLRAGGTIIVESQVAGPMPPQAGRAHTLPIVSTARALGAPQDANIVALGALCAIHPLVGAEVLEAVLGKRIRGNPARLRRALEAGFALGGNGHDGAH